MTFRRPIRSRPIESWNVSRFPRPIRKGVVFFFFLPATSPTPLLTPSKTIIIIHFAQSQVRKQTFVCSTFLRIPFAWPFMLSICCSVRILSWPSTFAGQTYAIVSRLDVDGVGNQCGDCSPREKVSVAVVPSAHALCLINAIGDFSSNPFSCPGNLTRTRQKGGRRTQSAR